ncbi:GNAT family N-acetyltransferase [Xenorhabdus szentirmaii]|nr:MULTISPECIES: GNAT family N-acetyltransferase [Xenorhabdus]MBD2781387.1 GNAT family N-acetyltransferase [Xenorhabdus sp. 38]MBD2791551.1 GNAT family N-acetyltransferase [Xenorhabdus sp. CUL]MBD2800544.1 GNAT family N-acetyltransferase [Xenorhabdus sp. M]MBD2821771.1 GNAT family N-acetyltransferase [Xenorhabdus sp. 42]MBD2826411.1 GNAT family N-acetyltransferase [Xenorhabdus sp. 5]
MQNLMTERLILRPWQETDAESLYEYAKDERVGPIAGWPAHKSIEESAQIIRDVFMVDKVYAVTLKSDNRAIGCIGLLMAKDSNFSIGDNDAEAAYWIGVPFWGQGLIPEALRELMRYGFEELKLENLWCGYFADNHKSKSVQEKCGFRHHHVIDEQYVVIMDEIRTENISRITRDEWNSL